MRSPLSPLRALAGAVMFVCALPVAAASADCNRAAKAACAQVGCERVLSAKERGGTCVVTMLVPGGQGQPPRRQTVNVPG